MTLANTAKRELSAQQKQQSQNSQTVAQLMERYKSRFEQALPKHLSAKRLLGVAMTELKKTPKLMECDPYSFMGALLSCAQLGLEPGSGLGHVYLVPYKGKVTMQLGYKGMIDLARRSGQIISLTAHDVYSKDEFSYELGLNEALIHKPYMDGDRGDLICVYAVAKLVGGGHQIGVMSKSDIEKVRQMSNFPNSVPWTKHFPEMAKKTVIRRLFKYLPVSIEMQQASEVEEAGERGQFDGARVLEGELDDGIVFDQETGEVLSEVESTSQADKLAASMA